MSSERPITFYDIASKKPLKTFAPNPWKTRLALNYKKLPYQTQWVQMPDIKSVREKLGVPANRTFPNGTPFHTLPVIHDTATGKLIGDSFEIALYLDSAYPDGPSLFRPLTTGLTAAFNANVDAVFTKFTGVCSSMPFDPCVEDAVMAMFAERSNGEVFDDSEEKRNETFVSFEAALGELAKAYRHTGGTTDHLWRAGGTEQAQKQRAPPGHEQAGPFLDGDEPVYADFIIGAWLKMYEASMETKDWQRVRAWQDGLWGRVVNALNEWSEIK